MQRLGGREDLIKNVRRVLEELTCYDGVLRNRQHWRTAKRRACR